MRSALTAAGAGRARAGGQGFRAGNARLARMGEAWLQQGDGVGAGLAVLLQGP